MSERREYKLGEITDNFDYLRIPVRKNDRKPGPYPYYGASGIADYVDNFIFDGEYLLIAEDGENLRSRATPLTYLVDGKFWVNNHAHIVRGNKRANTKFLAYLIENLDITPYLTGSTRPKLTQGHLNEINLIIPPLTEQKAIAHILGSLDDKIELNRRMNATLEAMAQATFKSWFVDFDPVRAKMEGRRPYGMDADTAALFPSRLVDSGTELGMIPEEWEVKAIGNIAKYVNGRNFTKDATGTGRIVIRIAELNSGIGGSTVFNSIEADPENTAYPDDILFSWSGSLGIYRWHQQEALINQHIFKVILKDYPKWFVYYQLLRALPFFQAIASHKATTMGHIKREHLSDVLMATPSSDNVIGFASARIVPNFNLIHDNEVQSQTLASLRDTLLPKLITGQLRVGEAIKMVEGM